MMRTFSCLSCSSSWHLANTGHISLGDGLPKKLLVWQRPSQGRQNSSMHSWEFLRAGRRLFPDCYTAGEGEYEVLSIHQLV